MKQPSGGKPTHKRQQDLSQPNRLSSMVQVEEARRNIGTDGRQAVLVVSTVSAGPPIEPAPVIAPSQQNSYGNSSISSVMTLCNSAVGAGVLSLPFAFSHTGLIGGILLCFTIGSAEAFTLYVLSKFAERFHADTYGALVRRSLGRKLTALLAVIMGLYLWGSSIVYLMIMGDSFSSIAKASLGEENLFAQRNLVITLIGIFILLPLCMLKRLGHLAYISTVAVGGFIFTACVILVLGIQMSLERKHIMDGVDLFRFDQGFLFAVPIVVFGFNCHANVVSIFSELASTPDILISSNIMPTSPVHHSSWRYGPRPQSHKLVNMLHVVVVAVTLIMSGYMMVGIAGYIGFLKPAGNVMDSLDSSKPIVLITQGLVGLVVLGHYPLNHHPARSGLFDGLSLLGVSRPSEIVSILFTLAFVLGSVAVARAVTSLGDALHLIGGTAAAFMIFFLPGAMLINASIMKQSANKLSAGEHGDVSLNQPLLRKAALKGVKAFKETGLVYGSGKSWAGGIFLLGLSIAIFVLTIYTSLTKTSD